MNRKIVELILVLNITVYTQVGFMKFADIIIWCLPLHLIWKIVFWNWLEKLEFKSCGSKVLETIVIHKFLNKRLN